MLSEPIEGEPSYLGTNSNLSPSMPTTDICFEPICKPILDPESYDDPILNSRNPLRHPKHRSHEGHKSNQEEQRQRLEHI